MKISHQWCWGALVLLLILNFFFAARVLRVSAELRTARETIAAQDVHTDVTAFTKLFVQEVLQAEGDVDFETRLQLENKVRALGDAEILAAWKRFVDSKTETDAQVAVIALLELLTQKL